MKISFKLDLNLLIMILNLFSTIMTMILADKVLQETIKIKNMVSTKDFQDSLTQDNIVILLPKDLKKKLWIRFMIFKIKEKNYIIKFLEKPFLMKRILKQRILKIKKWLAPKPIKLTNLKFLHRDLGLNLWKLLKPLNICKLSSKKLMYLEKE